MPEHSFGAIYEAYSKMVYWSAFGIVKDRETAADVMQTVFLRALKHRHKLDTLADPQLKAWLYRASVNLAIDRTRRDKRTVAIDETGLNEQADPSEKPEDTAISRDEARRVRDAVAALPEHYREPIMLYYFAQMGYHDIAALLNVSEGTLKSRMSRGREMLAKTLTKAGESEWMNA